MCTSESWCHEIFLSNLTRFGGELIFRAKNQLVVMVQFREQGSLQLRWTILLCACMPTVTFVDGISKF